MKTSAKINILYLTGAVAIWVSLFAKPLGIPSAFHDILSLTAIVFFYLGYHVSKKAKAAGQIPTPSDVQKRKRFALMVASCAAACILMPFVLPYTGVTMPFTGLVIISITSFFICMGAVWVGMKMKT